MFLVLTKISQTDVTNSDSTFLYYRLILKD